MQRQILRLVVYVRHLGSERACSALGYFREGVEGGLQFFHYGFSPDGLTLFAGGLACHITEK